MLVASGVAGMHTLGHPTSDGRGGSVDHSIMLVSREPMVEAVVADMTAAVQMDTRGTGMRLDPLNVCLAILVGGLLLLLVARLLAHRRSCPLFGRIRPAPARSGRGPPPRSPLGLRLADLSVQRT
jgi:hypothetical protein